MFRRLRQWTEGPILRSVTAGLTAAAAIAAVAFSVWTFNWQEDAEALATRQNGLVFDIVSSFGDTGATLRDIRLRYISTLSDDDWPAPVDSLQDDYIRSVLLRLAPSVVSADDRWYASGNAPLSRVQVFIDDISFGIPQIPDTYKSRSLTGDEVPRLLSPITNSTEVIQLEDDEVRRLNGIARISNQAAERPVSTERTYSPSAVVDLFDTGFAFYYEYTQWERATKQWSDVLRNEVDDQVQQIHSFVSTNVAAVPNNPGLFRALTGMATIQPRGSEDIVVSLAPEEGDCRETNATRIRFYQTLVQQRASYVLDWGNSISVVAGVSSSEDRIEAARALGGLFERACTKSLSRVFETASEIFGREHVFIDDYLNAWNEIFTARRPASLVVTATISNTGRYGTYVRREVRAGVGARGTGQKIGLTLVASDLGEDVQRSPYLVVPASTPMTYRFRAALESDVRNRLYGAFASGLNYIRIGILASVGESNRHVYSPVAPFSDEARRATRAEIDEVPIEF